jgi:hypothetical protein
MIKHISSKSHAETLLCDTASAGVVLASASAAAASTAATVTASTAITSASSSAHSERVSLVTDMILGLQ